MSINGVHKRVGKISEELAEKFALQGIRKRDYEFVLNDPTEDEVQTYTGNLKKL